jgi:hypothetical protein
MILYHFTSAHHLSMILATGLSEGDVPLLPGEPGYRCVWFTTDPSPADHGLSSGEKVLIPEAERRLIERQTGRPAPYEATTLDKRAVRIEVVIPSSDKKLFHWLLWSAKRTDAALRKALITTGGGKAKARTWYIYNGIVARERFRAVCIRNNAGEFIAADIDQLEH